LKEYKELNLNQDVSSGESNLETFNLPDKILDGLYLGSYAAAQNREALIKRNITHILTVGTGLTPYFPRVSKEISE
jgi:hypothetical protein